MKYRSEVLFGEGYRDAAEVMAHETFYMQNTDILHTLRETILQKSPICMKLGILEEEINNGCIADVDDGSLYQLVENADNNKDIGVEFFKKVLNEIKAVANKDIKYCLWLCDTKEDVKAYDLHDELTDDDIDEYQESEIVLSDIGSEGKLYGYEYLPMPTRLTTKS